MNNESKMSVTQLTILTAVNMMGSGIIMLPAKLAEVGGLSIVSWLVTAIGSMCLAYVFAKCGMYSRKQGGMNGYAEYTSASLEVLFAVLLTVFPWLLRILPSRRRQSATVPLSWEFAWIRSPPVWRQSVSCGSLHFLILAARVLLAALAR